MIYQVYYLSLHSRDKELSLSRIFLILADKHTVIGNVGSVTGFYIVTIILDKGKLFDFPYFRFTETIFSSKLYIRE